MSKRSQTAHVDTEVWEGLIEVLSQRFGLGSAANLDDFTRESLEEDLEAMVAEAHKNPRARYPARGNLVA